MSTEADSCCNWCNITRGILDVWRYHSVMNDSHWNHSIVKHLAIEIIYVTYEINLNHFSSSNLHVWMQFDSILDVHWYLLLINYCNARFPLPELTARVDGWPVSITRQHEPRWRAVDHGPSTRHDPCWRVMETDNPSTRAVNSGSGNRALVICQKH